ncbi:MAG: prepilin-type N-terminal cleavage/methylation domain-containing protein [Candidatus Shapirobacteria bacterium]|jgi:prepilin-type N-terminal cleavage/methylation domain-containing protein
MKKNRRGFTLIEMVVVTGIIGLMMVAVTGILLSSLQARNLTRMTDLLSANGNYALEEIRKNLLNANKETVVCPVGVGSSLSFDSVRDGEETLLKCDNAGRVASNSAKLTGGEVILSGCDEFVRCENGALGPVSGIVVKFVLSAGNASGGVKDFVSKVFESRVTLRN